MLYEKIVLNDIYFEIYSGDTIAFVGSNGARKSTLLKMFAGVKKPSLGRCEHFTDRA